MGVKPAPWMLRAISLSVRWNPAPADETEDELLELAAQWRTFSALDVQAALRPYLPTLAGAALALGLLALGCQRSLSPVLGKGPLQ